MPAAHTNRRPDALEWAKSHGWSHEEATFDDGQIIRDVFTHGDLTFRAVWLHTPFNPCIWARGLLTGPGKPATVARVSGSSKRPTVKSVLTMKHPSTQ